MGAKWEGQNDPRPEFYWLTFSYTYTGAEFHVPKALREPWSLPTNSNPSTRTRQAQRRSSKQCSEGYDSGILGNYADASWRYARSADVRGAPSSDARRRTARSARV